MNDEVFLATRDRVLECAYEVLNEQVTPYEGAKRMWAMQYEIDDLIELRERLTILVGLGRRLGRRPRAPRGSAGVRASNRQRGGVVETQLRRVAQPRTSRAFGSPDRRAPRRPTSAITPNPVR